MACTDAPNGSAGGWGDPLSEGDGGAWTVPTAAAVSPWETVELSEQQTNPWVNVRTTSEPKKPGNYKKPAVNPNPSFAEQKSPAKFKTSETDAGGWGSSPVQSNNGGWSKSPVQARNGSSSGREASPDPAAAEIEGKNQWDGIDDVTAKTKSTWESNDEVTPKAQNPWESESPCNPLKAKMAMEQKQISNGLKADLKPRNPVMAAGPPPECEEVDVPDSAVPHIIGQEHRTIRALKNVPGIKEVTISMVKGTDEDMKKNPLQRVKVEGSCKEAVTRVMTQIRRIVLRSATNSASPEISVTCLPQENNDAHAVSLKLATAEEFQHYMPKHLKTFVVQHAPQELQEKTYFTFGARTYSDQLTQNPKIVSRKRRRSYERDGSNHVFGSWDRSLYTNPLFSCMRKFYEEAGKNPSFRQRPPQIKLRIQLGKMFYFGTDLKAPDTWNVSLEDMKKMASENTLKPYFSCYCQVDIAEKARSFLKASGCERHKLATSQDTICAELVDMDVPDKPSFNVRLMQRDKIAAKINKKSRRHAYVTFADGKQGVDFQLRIQSRQRERDLDEKTRKQVFEAWSERTDIEEPLISPTGHHYYPLKVLRKVFEYYKKGDIEYVLTQVSSAVMDSEGPKEIENADNSRWKISLQSCIIPYVEDVDEDVEDIMSGLTRLVTEAKDFVEAISSG